MELMTYIDKATNGLKNEVKEVKNEVKNEAEKNKMELIKKIDENSKMHLIFNTILIVLVDVGGMLSNDNPLDFFYKLIPLYKNYKK